MVKKLESPADLPEKDENDVESVDTEANGQGRIPGTEIKVIKAIINLVARHEETKSIHSSATDKLKVENEEALVLFGKHKEHFTEVSTGKWLYEAGGARLEITEPQGASVTTKLIDEDE